MEAGRLYDLLASRRSIRKFKRKAPPREVVERLLAAAITAPSASNKQPWRFIVVTRASVIEQMADAVRAAVEIIARHIEPASVPSFRAYGSYFTRFEEAPVVIVALHRSLTILSNLVDLELPASDRDRIQVMEEHSGLMGVAMAIENLLLAAHAMGLGASGMTGPLVAADQIRSILDVPGAWRIAAVIPVGYPDETPPATDRKAVDKVARWVE